MSFSFDISDPDDILLPKVPSEAHMKEFLRDDLGMAQKNLEVLLKSRPLPFSEIKDCMLHNTATIARALSRQMKDGKIVKVGNRYGLAAQFSLIVQRFGEITTLENSLSIDIRVYGEIGKRECLKSIFSQESIGSNPIIPTNFQLPNSLRTAAIN